MYQFFQESSLEISEFALDSVYMIEGTLEEFKEDFKFTLCKLTDIPSDFSIDCFLFLELDFLIDLDLPELALQLLDSDLGIL
jgi:hypothetical protein